MPTSAAPHPRLLNDLVLIDENDDMPLHSQVRRALKATIENHFEHGQRFFTENELIEHLKVSQVTVRRALSDLVREGCLERRVAKGSFVRKEKPADGRITTVSVFSPDWDSSFLGTLLRGTCQACQARQIRSDIYYTQQGGKATRANGPDREKTESNGVILIANEPTTTLELYRKFTLRGQRVVNVDCWIDHYPGAFVGTDMLLVTRLGLDHLQALGHQRICLLVNEPETGGNVRARITHFETECAKRKLKHGSVVRCGTRYWENSYEKALAAMPKVLALKPRPTAIFAFDDPGAWAALKWLADEGIRVPKDMSVLGFADDKPSRYTYPALSTIAHPIDKLAEAAVDVLLRDSFSPEQRFLEPALVVRESTGPVPA